MKYPLTGHMWNVAPFNVLELHVLWWCGVCIGSLVFFDERDKASDWINYFFWLVCIQEHYVNCLSSFEWHKYRYTYLPQRCYTILWLMTMLL